VTERSALQGPTVPTKARGLVAGVALFGVAVTAAVAISPDLRFAYDRPPLHLVLETVQGLAALLIVYLLIGRLRQRRRLADALLVYALLVLGLTNLLGIMPAALSTGAERSVQTWWPAVSLTAGAFAMALAGWAPERRVTRPRRAGMTIGAAAGVTLALAWGLGRMAERVLGPVVTVDAAEAVRPTLDGHPLVLGGLIVGFGLFAVAAAGFLRRAEVHRDAFMGWIAASATLNAFARANYFLFPSLYTDYVYTGDLLRLGSYLLLLVGATREIGGYWRNVATAAVVEERSKIARDLHDGLAQELAFLATKVRALQQRADVTGIDAELSQLASASRRALGEAPRAVEVLAHQEDEPLDAVLAKAAEDVAERAGARVRFDLAPADPPTPQHTEQLVRIVCEAVTNATRHGGAKVIDLHLSCDEALVVRIRDDGAGFDVAAAVAQPGFGLRSMRERAQALGGTVLVHSAPGQGTSIEVRVPLC
jgi:signal transduction histidine kinase